MDVTQNCSVTNDTGAVGPGELYTVLGPGTALTVFASVPLLILTMLGYALYLAPPASHPYRLHIMVMQLAPTAYMMISYPVLLFPATLALVSMLQDLLAVSAMVVFVKFTLKYVGSLTELETETCPLGTPPLCCLRCCPYPRITKQIETLILLPFTITPIALGLNFLINLYMAYSGQVDIQEKEINQGSIFNIPNFLLIPFFVSMMYNFKIFFGVTALSLVDTYPRLRGSLMVMLFVIGKSFTGLFRLLSDHHLLPCVEGLSPATVCNMIVVLVELFLVTIIATVLPRLYSRQWISSKLPASEVTEPSENDKMINV